MCGASRWPRSALVIRFCPRSFCAIAKRLYFATRTEDLIVLDPPFGNPKNRSPIIDTIISVMRASKNKSVFLYTQDAYYIHR